MSATGGVKVTNDEIRKLIEDAKKATQGEWYIADEYDRYVRHKDTDDRIATMDGGYKTSDGENQYVDGRHIANTCPAKIVPLLEELLRLRGLTLS